MLPAHGDPEGSLLAREAPVWQGGVILHGSRTAPPHCRAAIFNQLQHQWLDPITLWSWPASFPPVHFFPFRICLSLLFFMLLNIWATDDPVSTLLPLTIILSFFTSQQNFSQVFFRSVNNVVQLGQVRAGPWSLGTQAIKPLRKKGDSSNGSSLTFS